jgi:hypothetical protein
MDARDTVANLAVSLDGDIAQMDEFVGGDDCG